jgi:tryptophan-rich sensory protein
MLDGLEPRAFALAAGWAVLTAASGAMATDLGPWYRQLRKPSWQPPDWLFGPAWTVIFLLTALAGVLAWCSDGATPADRRRLVELFALNGVLNVLWSVLFFRRHRPDLAVVEVVPLWLSVLLIALAVGGLSSGGALLLMPYLIWVAFAAVLNAAIVRLNPISGS